MNPTQAIEFLHVTFVVLALGMMIFPGILLRQIALTGDVAAIRTAYRVGMYHGRVGALLLGIGVIFGLGTAAFAHFPLTSGWLSAAYVAVVLIVILGVAFHQRHEAAILAAAAGGGQDAGAECVRLARSPAPMVLNITSVLVWLFAIFDMIVKPF